MPIKAPKSKEFEYEPVPEDNHIGICYAVVDLGFHENDYMGNVTTQRKLRLSWILPNTAMEKGDLAGKPFSVSKEYTFSMTPKANLFKDMRNWIGAKLSDTELQEIDFEGLLGVPAMVNVVHKESQRGNIYAVVAGVSRVPKGIEVPALEEIPDIEPLTFSLESEAWEEELRVLPEWLQEKINPIPPHVEEEEDFDIEF